MAILTTGKTYVNNDQVSALNLNQAVNGSTFASGAVDGSSTQLSGGAIIVRDGGISLAKQAPLAANSLIGNATGSSATPTAVSCTAAGRTIIAAADAAAQRTALSLGGAALLAVGTTAGTVAAGDDSRITGAAQKASNLSDLASVATARTNLGATTVGSNVLTLTNPSAIRFVRINADNTVSALSDADFRTAIGAGSGGGTVSSVEVSGGTTGLTTSGGPITSSGTITLAGTLAIANGGTGATTAGAALTALGGYAASNPSGFTSNTGTIGGTSGSTDNRLIRADGTGGSTVQTSPVQVDDSGNVDGVANLTASGVVNTTSEYRVSGTKVLGAQAAAEANVSVSSSFIGGDTVSETDLVAAISDLQNKVNALLAKLRTHGIIAT